MEKELVFNPNPFLQRAFYVESPMTEIYNHWAEKEFDIKAFKSGNVHDRWVYFKISDNLCVKATPEFLDDTEVARIAFKKMINLYHELQTTH